MRNASVDCPLRTTCAHSPEEHASGQYNIPEIRAYKLGKKRWSYNQVELVLGEADCANRAVAVRQVVHAEGIKFHQAHQDSAVGFHVDLESGAKLQARIFLCYTGPCDACSSAAALSSGSGGERAPATKSSSGHHSWHLVTRKDCCKGCEGRVLRSIQRIGRQGKRLRNGQATPPSSSAAEASTSAASASCVSMKKDPKFMYLSLDEACSHVAATAFRLVAGIYNRQGSRLLATSVSPPIRVLANNDVPTGPAHIKLVACLPADWEEWGLRNSAPFYQLPAMSRADTSCAQPTRPRPIQKTSANMDGRNMPLPNPLLPAATISLSLIPSSEETPSLLPARTQGLHHQLQYSKQGSFDIRQHSACSLASMLPLPVGRGMASSSQDMSGHPVCGGASPHTQAADKALPTDYIAEDCPEPPNHWLAPAARLEAASKAGKASEVPIDCAAAQAVASATAPHVTTPMSKARPVLEACWDEMAAHLQQAAPSMQAPASVMMPQWQPPSHCPLPVDEFLLADSLDLPTTDSKQFNYGAADPEHADHPRCALPGLHEQPLFDELDMGLLPLFSGI